MILNWQSRPEDYYAIDIETDDLNASRVWCMGWENIKTRDKGLCIGKAEIYSFLDAARGSVLVGHNGLKFDYPTVSRLVGIDCEASFYLLDTIVLSTIYNPSLEGGHSLHEWGNRLKMPKGEFNNFANGYTEEMGVYCQQDVAITAELFRKITKVLAKIGFSEQSLDLQHKITAILYAQERNGFRFNMPESMYLYQHLRQLETSLKEQVHVVFPPRTSLVRHGPIYKKDGGVRVQFLKDKQQLDVRTSGDYYEAYVHTPFNLGSAQQRVERLQELGWEHWPDEVTKKGNPKPFDKGDLVPSLIEFLEANPTPEIELIARWMSYNGRANMINNWMEHYNEETGCIHGRLFVADTLRFRHQAPNSANVPGVRLNKAGEVLMGEQGLYTFEARNLWVARPQRVLVGTDAAGLELRMLAHYLNRPSFTEQVVNGDPHQYNADVAGVDRPRAKTLLYAIQYGAQARKVASIIKGTTKEGAALREQFLERLGLKEIMEDAIREQQSGRVWLVDGAGVVCPSPHSALNYRLQGGGARVMAMGATILDGYIQRDGLDCLKVGDIHDEWQYDVHPSDARQFAERSVQAIREAGECLNLNVPLDGTAKQGMTWAQTH